VHVLHGHTDLITSVAFSLDCKRIVSGSSDRTIRIWDAETGKVVGEPFRGRKNAISSVALSPDGGFVVSGSHDGVVQVWNVDTRETAKEPFRGHEQHVTCVAFSSDSKYVVSGSTDRTIQIWDVVIGKPVGEPLRGHKDEVTSVAFSYDGKHIVSGSVDKTARIWDVETRVSVGEPLRGHTDVVTSVAFSPDGKAVVSASRDETVRIWDVEKGVLVRKPFNSVPFSLNYRARVVSRIWGVDNGVAKPLRGINSAAFSPDGNHVVSGRNDITIWDVETGEPVGNLNLFPGYTGSGEVREVKYSSDGMRILVLGSSGLAVHMWAGLIMDMAESDDLSTTSSSAKWTDGCINIDTPATEGNLESRDNVQKGYCSNICE
jgi:WD40 repeat protein